MDANATNGPHPIRYPQPRQVLRGSNLSPLDGTRILSGRLRDRSIMRLGVSDRIDRFGSQRWKESTISGLRASWILGSRLRDINLERVVAIQRVAVEEEYSYGFGKFCYSSDDEGGNGRRGDDRVSDLSSSPMERVRPARRLWRRNRGLDHELLTKMNELEGLLAAHKMARAGDLQLDRMHKARERRPAPDRSPEIGNAVDFDGNFSLSIGDDEGCSYHAKKLECLRGRLYEKYMEKRDAKLREEWGLRRTYKEAKMKAMLDSLEQSQAELKARFGRSEERKDLAFQVRHAEKLKSFVARSMMKDTEQQTVEFIQTKEEENLEQKVQYVQFKFYDDTRLNDGSSSSTDSKKLYSSRSVPSSTSQKSVAPNSRSPIKSGSIRQRTQPENPLIQSVSNNSHHRKENMKPLAGTSKITPRSQSWTHARSMSISEGVHIVKEEKPPRSKSMRNISISSGELKDLSSVNTSIPRPTPSRFSKEQSKQTSNRFQKIHESKPFLRRGNGIGPGAGAAIARSRTCIASEMQKSGEESEGLVGQYECSPDTVEYKDEEELGRTSSEGRETGFPSDSDSGKSRSSQELGSISDPRPANGDDFTAISKADDDSPTASKFIASAGSMEELQEQNPESWNSHIKYPHSNSHEASDVDASVAMNQMEEADPARVRKKWKKAEKLVLATKDSHQPRNGVAEGFRRWFKFGKKRKVVKSIINVTVSVSAASGAGDDIENDRDLASQSSDDLRKLRMDYSVPAYHDINEGKVFPDQAVPSLHCSSPGAPTNSIPKEDCVCGNSPKAHRSMLSIPSFHSKGRKSKLK
uniref:Uncharacterized protein LOC105042024 n=1 Tax=Elaeis guineensis var. tenera TaxID=51953 RepID=A0A8N4EV41_ELAGV|nr:uncharacterized protein LOC105042024 [Elaeis guineensis]